MARILNVVAGVGGGAVATLFQSKDFGSIDWSDIVYIENMYSYNSSLVDLVRKKREDGGSDWRQWNQAGTSKEIAAVDL